MGTSYEMHRVLYTSPVQSRRCKIYVPGRYLGSDGAVDMHVVRKYSTVFNLPTGHTLLRVTRATEPGT